MILIVSENNDLTTDVVIDWLYYFEINNIVRINKDDHINLVRLDPINEEIIIQINDDKQINLSDVNFFWYRRGNLNNFIDRYFETGDVDIQKRKFLNYEWLMCRNYLFHYLNQKPSLGSYFKSITNKLINLCIAKKCGFKVPETLISSEQIELNKIVKVLSKLSLPIIQIRLFHKIEKENITENGYIKNCPSMKKHYGNIKDIDLKNVVGLKEFQKL